MLTVSWTAWFSEDGRFKPQEHNRLPIVDNG